MAERVDVAGVLAAHQRMMTKPGGPCWCGQWPTSVHDETWMDHTAAAIAAHIGAVLASAEVREVAAEAFFEELRRDNDATWSMLADAALIAIRAALAIPASTPPHRPKETTDD